MNEQTVNIPLLRKAVEWAEAEAAKPPELCECQQEHFVIPADPNDPLVKACGTCYCVAGFVAAQSGKPWFYSSAETVARIELGLDWVTADELFDCYNTIADVRRIAEDIAGERL